MIADRIEIDPKVMMGKPVIRGTRIKRGGNPKRFIGCISSADTRGYSGMPSYARRSMSGSDCTKPKACRFPDQHLFAKSKRLSNFIVEGEQHYCVHIAIDRFTGQVVDKQTEVVNE